MKLRDDLLTQSWTGPQLTLGGRELILSPSRFAQLQTWGNEMCSEGKNPENPMHAMGEMILVCWSTKEEILQLRKLSKEQRTEKILDFMFIYEEEFTVAANGLMDRLNGPIQSSMVESESPGKGGQVHAS